ncbi:MAG: phosphoenolpyruvate--protein phosphotransferase [Gammaproteobacteria bacterium]|nr:phosphoenolpyruvate--protein phosphotransferase [Gammaproteobacteria bacterium]
MSILINGIGVSGGIAIGDAYVYSREQEEVHEYRIPVAQHKKEIQRFKKALAEASKQLNEIKNKIADDTPPDILAFIDTHLLMLEDPTFNEGTIANIKNFSYNAEWALNIQSERLVKVFDEMDDPYLRTRKDDVLHVVRRIQNCLAETPDHVPDPTQLKGRIIIADDLTPADTLMLQHHKIAGFVTEYGGPLSHTAILSKNIGIPAIVGARHARKLIQSGETLIIDGSQGMLINSPDYRSLKHYRALRKKDVARKTLLNKLKFVPAITTDGKAITLHGNINRPEDIRALKNFDDTGVGLYRTEMLFIERNEWPDEETQFKTYKRALFRLKGQPLTIRTIDLGADKEIQDTIDQGPMAHNPAMGLRAIRRCMKEPELFIPQLRAILRVAALGPVRMMIPMLTNIEELKQVQALIERTKKQLIKEKVRIDKKLQIGAMIEVPAAALAADAFARQLDFLSIGTNDLIQYTLALDRIDDEISYLYNPLNPAVLQLIQITINAGKKAGIPVSLCGEMASNPQYTRLLLGMGLEYFSIQANALLEVKHIINNSNLSRLRSKIKKILELQSTHEIESEINQLNQREAEKYNH